MQSPTDIHFCLLLICKFEKISKPENSYELHTVSLPIETANVASISKSRDITPSWTFELLNQSPSPLSPLPH